MNKGRRHELKMLKFKKRLKLYGLKPEEGKYYSFRSHGAPCSCGVCRGEKFSRPELVRRTKEELEASRSGAYEYLIP